MLAGGPKWRRRKEARPAEIIAAALEVFAEKGFAAARLDDIAARAGVSKGALYLYFETKQDLFTAVVREAVAPNLDQVAALASAIEMPFADLTRLFYQRAAEIFTVSKVGAVAKMVVGESRNFPEIARVWHDEVVVKALGLVGGFIARAQAKGEVRAGDPRLMAVSMMGPMILGVLWREVLEPAGAEPIDIRALAAQHAETVLSGLLIQKGPDR
jgi:AcrR family transcriptional regulator